VNQTAEAIDRRVETVAPQLAAEIENAGFFYILLRAEHRREHLDQIEEALVVR
jgi:hypothetical protein